MLNITKENNSIRVEATDYSFYPFNGVVTYPLNSVIVVTDKSNMATFKSSTNGDVLFVGNISELTIGGENVTKDTIVGEFTKIANSSGSSIDTSDFAKKTDLDTLSAEVEHKADKTTVYTIEETDGKLDKKQNKLVAGENITLTDNTTDGTTTIAAAGGVNGLVIDENKVTAGLNQTIEDDAYKSVAIGNNAKLDSNLATAIGNRSTAGNASVAIGSSSTADGPNSVAIGSSSTAGYSGCTAIGGENTLATGTRSTAIGSSAAAKANNGLALGANAIANNDTPLVISAGNHFHGYNNSKMITGDSKGKISIPLADGTTSMMCIQDEINALKAGGSGGSGGTVDAYTKAESDAKYALKSEVEELKAQLVTLTYKLNTINGEDI